MTDTTTQPAAADTNVEAQPQTAATGAQNDDLESLLRSFDDQTSTRPQPQPAPATVAAGTANVELATLQAEVKALKESTWRAKDEADTADAVRKIKGDLEIPDYAVQGWLIDKARNDPRISQLWNERDQRPRDVQRMIERMKVDFAKEQAKFKPVDANATADREAVTAAVKGASTTRAPAEPAPSYGKMTDSEFLAEKRKLGLA